MLRELIARLQLSPQDPKSRLADLVAWLPAERSRRDLALDLQTAMAVGALNDELAARLLAELEGMARSSSAASDLVPLPDKSLSVEVAALEVIEAQRLREAEEARRVEAEITLKSEEILALEEHIEQLRMDIAAAEARCEEQQRRLEEAHERHPESVPAGSSG